MTLAHAPVLPSELVEAVLSDPEGLYVDGTFGRGGHSRLLLSRLGSRARLVAFDKDPEAVAAAAAIEDARFRIVHAPFSSMGDALAGEGPAAGVMLDIGVSSPQIDDPARGFSLRADGPLDMRMDTSAGLTAAEWIAAVPEAELARVLRDYGEERFARRIARGIVARREKSAIRTTRELADLVAASVPRSRSDASQHPATRSFQAIRIAVNGELDELAEGLSAAAGLLGEGGRLAVISFHSLEDRIAKRFFARASRPGEDLDGRIPLRASELPEPWFRDVRRVLPGAAERAANPRARSAVLRSGVRTARAWPGQEPWR